MNHRRCWFWSVALLLGGLVSVASPLPSARTGSSEGPLLARSRPRMPAKDWVGYAWLAPNQLLAFRGQPLHLFVDDIVRVDLRTRTTRPIPGFRTHWRAIREAWSPEMKRVILQAKPSPDGQWLFLDTKGDWEGPADSWKVASLSGKPWVSSGPSMLNDLGLVVWSRDSRRLIGIRKQALVVYDRATARVLTTVDLTHRFTWPEETTWYAYWVGMKPDGRVVQAICPTVRSQEVAFYEFGIPPLPLAPREYRLTRPRCNVLEEIRFSPDGKQMLWSVYCDDASASGPARRTELWVSRLDGKAMRRLGWLPTPLDDYHLPDPGAFLPHWLPDSRRISFLAKGSLHILSVR